MKQNLITKNDLLKYLNISMGKLNKMIQNNEIPFIKSDKIYRFDIEEVLNKLKSKNG